MGRPEGGLIAGQENVNAQDQGSLETSIRTENLLVPVAERTADGNLMAPADGSNGFGIILNGVEGLNRLDHYESYLERTADCPAPDFVAWPLLIAYARVGGPDLQLLDSSL